MPQRPQPVGPAICRRRSLKLDRALDCASHIRSSMPSSSGTMSSESISSGRLDDAFAEAEADREIFEILRRAHHHGIGAAIIGQRQRGLFRNRALAVADAGRRARLAIDACEPDRASSIPRHPPTGAMRREWRACSS